MPIKKSGLLVIALSLCSISLLVFSSDTTSQPIPPVFKPVSCLPEKSCNLAEEPKFVAPWDVVSQIVLRSAV